MKKNRRKFIQTSGQFALGMGLFGLAACNGETKSTNKEEEKETQETTPTPTAVKPFFEISLAQWSLHRALEAGEMDNLDFAPMARTKFGIGGVEYVNKFFKDKAKDTAYLDQMNQRAADNNVKNLLIMIDGEGNLGDTDEKQRKQAVENHHKWVDAAKYLGCHSIRVNAGGDGSAEEVAKAAIESLSNLSEYAKKSGINVIVENHGGYSSNGGWLYNVINNVGKDNCGTLPDFGNFCIKKGDDGNCLEDYDRYKGVKELMSFAKAVSAKTHDFDEQGNEIHTDYMKMMKIVKSAGYTGFVGIEYEGNQLSEEAGIMATKKLLEKIQKELM